MEYNSVIQFWPLLNFNKKTNLMSNYIWLKTRMKYSATVVNNLFKNSEMTRIWAFMRLVNLKLIQYTYLTIKRFWKHGYVRICKRIRSTKMIFCSLSYLIHCIKGQKTWHVTACIKYSSYSFIVMNLKLGFPLLTLARQMPNIYSLNEITDWNIKIVIQI